MSSELEPKVLRQLSKTSGREAFFQKSSERLVDLPQLAHNIRNQYLQAYRASNRKHDGTFRRVHVTVYSPNRKISRCERVKVI